jgi:hypothetical protein
LHEYCDGPVTTRTTPHPLTGVKNPVIQVRGGERDRALLLRAAFPRKFSVTRGAPPVNVYAHLLSLRRKSQHFVT